ncbi:centrosomal protein CEP57L1 isoform X2 [Antennarius striatus]|uniref:centrosomal protein CEP57L1 isoform X2 n=1 Tax=Antennarius striatus TaxID=241820 RepID=UPI0035ADD813
METYYDQISDSLSKNSYIGSYYQPPDRILPRPRALELSPRPPTRADPQLSSPETKPNIDSPAVVDALKTLQRKIRQLELERKQAEKCYRQISHDAQDQQQVAAEAELPDRKELDSKLQAAETRCSVLEKQLDYMRKMIEGAKEKRNTLMENQASLQSSRPRSHSGRLQQEKLDKLESECAKLSITQSLAEAKLKLLEQKLLEEEHERQLVQEKAEQLQRELDVNQRLSLQTCEETKKKTKKKSLRRIDLPSPTSPERRGVPFITGTSTSPSHSLHANMQSLLHMMKHHQPRLCQRLGVLRGPAGGAKKRLQKDFPQSPAAGRSLMAADQSPESLSDLLLALQDELGHMSFEQQELAGRIDAAGDPERRRDLQGQLEGLGARMEEKAAQISKLRQHQQRVRKTSAPQVHLGRYHGVSCLPPPQVHKLTRSRPRPDKQAAPSPVQQGGKKRASAQKNLQLLRDTQKLRHGLGRDDLSWET